ncbi:MAG: hypothetical protein ABI461_01750, partial [Polyangiaceae bacterium]
VTVLFVKNGQPLDEVPVTADPFSIDLDAPAPQSGEDRYRVEVLVSEKERTVTSHLFVKFDPNGPDGVADAANQKEIAGGGCDVIALRAPADSFAWVLAFAAGVFGLTRRRRQK